MRFFSLQTLLLLLLLFFSFSSSLDLFFKTKEKKHQNHAPLKGKNLFFIHIGNTGGTTFTHILSQSGFFVKKRKSGWESSFSKTCLEGNYGYSTEIRYNTIQRQNFPAECYNKTIFFSFIRNPKDWLQSAYSHTCRLHKKEMRECNTNFRNLDSIIQTKKHYFATTPFQSSFVSSLLRDERAKYILCRTDCFNDCLKMLQRLFDRNFTPISPLNNSPNFHSSNDFNIHNKNRNKNKKNDNDNDYYENTENFDSLLEFYYKDDIELYNSFNSCSIRHF